MQTAVNAWVLGRARGWVVNQEVGEEKKGGSGGSKCAKPHVVKKQLEKGFDRKCYFCKAIFFLSRC